MLSYKLIYTSPYLQVPSAKLHDPGAEKGLSQFYLSLNEPTQRHLMQTTNLKSIHEADQSPFFFLNFIKKLLHKLLL